MNTLSNVASFSRLSMSDYPFGILLCLFQSSIAVIAVCRKNNILGLSFLSQLFYYYVFNAVLIICKLM
jgi:hypothetical protein